MDTRSWHEALKNTLRQAPDVILIGEIRDRETMEHALAFAETGHLAISTLHANNANQALDRIINFFPEDRRDQLLMDLSTNIRAFVSQRLGTHHRWQALRRHRGNAGNADDFRPHPASGEFEGIKEIMEKSEQLGMQTFDSALFKLFQDGRITEEEALKNADSPNNVRSQDQVCQGGVASRRRTAADSTSASNRLRKRPRSSAQSSGLASVACSSRHAAISVSALSSSSNPTQ